MNLLRKIDIYGQYFNFYIRKEEKLKTAIGGFFTIFFVLISFTISFFFGKDFYYRTNPQVVFTYVSPKYSQKYKLTNKKLTIAYRLEDDNGNFIDFSDYLFIKASFVQSKNNNGFFVKTNSHRFEIKKCSELNEGNQTNAFTIPIQPDDWYCLDFAELTDKYLGGNYNGEEDMSEIFISLDSCNFNPLDNSTNVKNENLLCRDADELDFYFKKQNNKIFINIMFPYVSLNTDQLDKPYEILHYFHFKKLDFIMTIEEYCNLEYFEFHDDQGWIFNSNKNHTFPTYKECSLNGKYVEKSRYTKDRMNTLFEVIVTMNKVYAKARRKYMKIQDVFAITGGFVTFMRLILSFLSASFNRLERSKILIDFYFGDNCKENNSSTNISRVITNTGLNHFKVIDDKDKNYKNINLITFNLINYNNSNHNNTKSRRLNMFVKDNINNSSNVTIKPFDESILINDENSPLENKKKLNSNLALKSRASGPKKIINSNKNKKIYNKFIDPMINNLTINRSNCKVINGYTQNKGTNNLVKNVSAPTITNFNDYSKKINKGVSYSEIEKILSQDKKDESIIKINFSSDFVKENLIMDQNKIEELSFREKINLVKLQKQNSNFSDISVLKDTCFRKILNRNDQYKKIIDLFEKLEKKVLGKIDIIHYLKNMKYLKMMKNILFESNQRFYIKNYYEKAIIFNKFKNDNDKTEEQMIKYFEDYNSRISKRNFSFEDNLLHRINKQIFKDID